MVAVSKMQRFLACRRASVALESAIAISALVVTLATIFEITHTVFVGDLLQRAANSVGQACALNYEQATNATILQTSIEQHIRKELGTLLDFELAQNGTCTRTEDSDPADYCLKAEVEVYATPIDMLSGTPKNNAVGGASRDMVIVRLTLLPLGTVQQQLLGDDGLQAVAIVRNEGIQT